MTDTGLRRDVYLFLAIAMLLGLVLFFWPLIEYAQFQWDCGREMGYEYCRDLWVTGNGGLL
jgi:hypothetical protein